ncbi:MAG TPA: vanadium-dependent haloperoxidase [Acidimicrobiia bacterium]|nr:vanadium-dependent haloperoxidase [Acidimicrobiia bacterium]
MRRGSLSFRAIRRHQIIPHRPSGTALRASFVALAVAVALVACTEAGPSCSPGPEHPEWSTARQWNEVLLDGIRRDLPAPTVHARNLYHVSAAMWDAWAAYDSQAQGVYFTEKVDASDIGVARAEAISYAAYRVLEARYLDSIGATETIPEFDALMASMCLDIDVTMTEGDTPAAVGNRIAATILAIGREDGSNEAEGYASESYEPVNPPLIVRASGTEMVDPNRWQPLQIEGMMSQNGIVLADGVQEAIDPHWGHVVSFALPDAGETGVPIDPGPPPALGDPSSDWEFKESALDVIRYSGMLDPGAGEMIDASPGSIGGNPIGTNDGTGHPLNPVTGEPYEPYVIAHGDFGRVVAEYWADGPKSETPPGHWNKLANDVSDRLGDELRIAGEGDPVDRLEWDVKMYLALNGANHDAAIAAWGLKGYYDSARPISMIRWMGGLGQSSDPDGPAYHPDGLPLADGIVEVVTALTSTIGGRHEHLEGHEGEVAVFAYRGGPADREAETGGVGWILAVDWVPYQAPTFVTPSFPGYVSGHSTFSRASAEVLTAFTGDAYFPEGLGTQVYEAGGLHFEQGPDDRVTLQWATYRDAADQAGISRIYGGIHVRADDFEGRRMGEQIGRGAWEKALEYFDPAGAG